MDEYPELVADFQSIYQLNVLDGIRGGLEAGYALRLIEGLRKEPLSGYRAHWLRDNPAPAGDGELGFLGWSQDSAILTALVNIVATIGAQKQTAVFKPPSAVTKPRLFARTLAEFNESQFMAAINRKR